MPHFTAIVTLLAVLFYFFLGTRVAVAHGKYGVKLPAVTGHPDFERVYRVQMNTLEWAPIFLPLLLLCAIYFNDKAAAVLGLVWVAGRIYYYIGYTQEVEKRFVGFLIQALAWGLLLIGAIVGIVRVMLE